MNVTRHEIVHWFTTPKQLREIADEMERFWRTCKPGQDKTVHVDTGKDMQLMILVDQDKIDTPGWFGGGVNPPRQE